MTRELSHDEAFAELDAVAFDLLDAPERHAVLEHVGTCEVCRAELDGFRATASNLAFAAASGAAPHAIEYRDRVRGRLLARAAEDSRARLLANPPLVFPPRPYEPATPPQSAAPRWRGAEWFALAAGVLFVASTVMLGLTWRDRQGLRDSLAAETAQGVMARHTADSLAALVASRDSLIAGIAGRDVAVMTLTSNAAKEPYARMFWDHTRNTWTLIAHNMPALKPGRTYQLWLVTRTAKISAGTFESRRGDAVVRATYALAPDSLRAIAVTEEPAGGVPQPTGAIVVAANATH